MFCQHVASSLPSGERGSESRCFADLTIDTVAMFAQTRTLAIDCFEYVPNGLKPDRFRDPVVFR